MMKKAAAFIAVLTLILTAGVDGEGLIADHCESIEKKGFKVD